MYICGVSHCEGLWEPGEVDRGRLLPPRLLADQLTLSQLGGAVDYIHFTTCPLPRIFRPSYGPALNQMCHDLGYLHLCNFFASLQGESKWFGFPQYLVCNLLAMLFIGNHGK